MAFCANCGHEISDLAVACPSCAHPTPVRVLDEYADFWSRFAAYLIDGLILLIPSIIFMALATAWTFAIVPDRFQGLPGPFNVFGYAIGFIYNWLMLSFNDGQTVGKKVMGIKIMRADRTPIDSGLAAGRSGMAIVSGIPFALGYLWAAWDPERRTWHDMVANTRAFKVAR